MLFLTTVHTCPGIVTKLAVKSAEAIDEFGRSGSGPGWAGFTGLLAAVGSTAAVGATLGRETADLVDLFVSVIVAERLSVVACKGWSGYNIDVVRPFEEVSFLVEIRVCLGGDLVC